VAVYSGRGFYIPFALSVFAPALFGFKLFSSTTEPTYFLLEIYFLGISLYNLIL